MPRQMPSSMKDAYVPVAAQIPGVNRKSLSRGRGGPNAAPSIANKQVSIKQGMKTTMTANSGHFFPSSGVSNTNTLSTRNNATATVANKRSSIYASSDSSDELIRGEMRRGSAPQMYHPKDKERTLA